jgi:preprotein translocase subunit SecA
MIQEHQGVVAYEDFNFELLRTFSVQDVITEEEFIQEKVDVLADKINKRVREAYDRKGEIIRKQAFPVIKDVYEKQGKVYENIVVPFTDGARSISVVTNLEKSYNTKCQDMLKTLEKTIMLATVDELWKEHLRELDELKQSVQNATYEQKDPLLIYKFESFELFKSMVNRYNKDVISVLMRAHIPTRDPESVKEAKGQSGLDMSKYAASRSGGGVAQDGSDKAKDKKTQPVRVDKKVGRNEPCPCGSGKKYKNCHGKKVHA